MSSRRTRIAEGIEVGGGAPLAILAGPDVIESETHALRIAEALAAKCRDAGAPFVFKSSFDKANRTSIDAFRGPGLEEGLRVLERVRDEVGCAVTTDVHTSEQASAAGDVVDLLQVPAFLCRQTDLLVAAGRTGRAVNVKKGQFVAPHDTAPIVEKVRSTGNEAIVLTERGTTFGYNNLVVDFRGLARMRALGVPVCFDATHSVQLPGGMGSRSGGEREFVSLLARAAVAAGCDALFFEVHDDPDAAPCDGPNMLHLDTFDGTLRTVLALDRVRRETAGA